MLNSLGKVETLKIEIDQIKQQLFASVPESQSSPSKLNEKEALISKLHSLKQISQQKKDEFVANIQGIQKKLQSLAQKKQATNKSKSFRGKYQSQVAMYEKELDRVSKEYQAFSENYDRLYGVSLDPGLYENNLVPIENQLKQVVSKHNSLTETLKNLEQERERMENTLKMVLEDIISQSAAKAEKIMERENLETQLELLEYDFAEELEYNEPEDNFIVKMLKLKKTKDPVLGQLQGLKIKSEGVDGEVEKIKAKVASFEAEIVRMCTTSPGFEELRNVEEHVKEKSKVFKTDSIEKVISDVNSVEGFDIDEEILKLQIVAIEKEEKRIRDLWNADFQELTTIIQYTNSTNKDSDEFKSRLASREKSFKLKIAAVKAWKNAAEGLVSKEDNYAKIVQDNLVIQEFKSQFSSINYKEHKKLENLMNAYLAVLDKRENFYRDFPLSRKLAEKENLLNEITSEMLKKPQILNDLYAVQSQLEGFEKEEVKLTEGIKALGIVPNSSKAQYYLLKEKIQSWDENESPNSESTSTSNEVFFEYKQKVDMVRSETEGLRKSLESVSNEEFVLSSEVEKILEQKRANMLNSLQDLRKTSKNPEEMKMYELNYRVVEASTRVEKATKELKDFDANINGILSNIENEEVSLRKQQIEIEESLKELESELTFIIEYEMKLKKLDQWDIASAMTIDNYRSPLEEYLGAGKGPEEGVVAEGNYLEFAEKVLGRGAQVPRSRVVNKKYFRIRLENTSQADRNFFEKIMPLLEGAELYKKLSEKSRKFDPLGEVTPEACGYTLRQIRLHKSLEKIEMKNPLKPGFDIRITTEQLCNPKVSKVTLALLQSQGHEELDFTEAEGLPVFIPSVQQPRDNLYYPFTIVLKPSEQIEVISKDYITFKQWIQGINALVSNKKRLAKLKTRIETYTSV